MQSAEKREPDFATVTWPEKPPSKYFVDRLADPALDARAERVADIHVFS